MKEKEEREERWRKLDDRRVNKRIPLRAIGYAIFLLACGVLLISMAFLLLIGIFFQLLV